MFCLKSYSKGHGIQSKISNKILFKILDIQLAQLILGRFEFYAMILGYFDLQKVPLKVMLGPWDAGS